MNSIRRTLLLWVTLLFVSTTVAVGAIVYDSSQDAIKQKWAHSIDAAKQSYEEKRDEALQEQARLLGRTAQSQFNPDLLPAAHRANQVFLMLNGFLPNSVLTNHYFFVSTRLGPTWSTRTLPLATQLKIDEEIIHREAETAPHEFIQVGGISGGGWVSAALRAGNFVLPPPPIDEGSDIFETRFDDISLPNGKTARRVTIRVPLTKFNTSTFAIISFLGGRPVAAPTPAIKGAIGLAYVIPSRRFGGGTRPAPVPQPAAFDLTVPNLTIQCAWEESGHPILNDLQLKRDAQIQYAHQQLRAELAHLRERLAWLAGFSSVALILGVWVSITFGLRPLNRVTEAVSQITPKDFQLSVDIKKLPIELQPVVDRLSHTLSELRAAFTREKRAAADISHELRTPLAALRTTLEVTLKKTRSPEQYQEAIQDALTIARSLSRLVDRMLKLAWIDAGSEEVRPEVVEIGPLVQECAAVGKPLAEAQGIKLSCETPNQMIIETDPDKFREIVMNLMHNAIEYNRPGGIVELKAQKSSDGGLILEVIDTGIGMSPETKEKIFERFFRADPSRNATGVHSGLGLAIVKEYVDRLGGRLNVESELGRGSRFRLELPNAS